MTDEVELVRDFESAIGCLIQAAIEDAEIADDIHWSRVFDVCQEIKTYSSAQKTLSKSLCSSLFEHYTGVADVIGDSEECRSRMHELTLAIGEVFESGR